MKTTIKRTRAVVFHTIVFLLTIAFAASGQSTKVSGTLRHGSGLLDIPVASVLPHMALMGTYSGFWTSNEVDFSTDGEGRITGTEPFEGGWNGDLALALGLLDFLEVGATVQSLEGTEGGGALWGAFGRLSLLNPQVHGLGLAVGGRYLSSPDFGDGVEYAPTRLGRADRRMRDRIGTSSIDTEFSFYAVAGADLPGFDSGFLPKHDLTLSAGWGNGLFKEGDGLEWHEFSDSEGWFAGAAWHLQVGHSKIFTLMSEYNGFDWNLGGQLDLDGVVVGAHVLGVNYSTDASVYRSSKFGLKVSVALEELRPALDFAGTYAESRPWFEAEESIPFDGREFDPSAGPVRLSCDAIRQVSEHMGVPLFVMENLREPWEIVYVPVRPGVWQAYEAGS